MDSKTNIKQVSETPSSSSSSSSLFSNSLCVIQNVRTRWIKKTIYPACNVKAVQIAVYTSCVVIVLVINPVVGRLPLLWESSFASEHVANRGNPSPIKYLLLGPRFASQPQSTPLFHCQIISCLNNLPRVVTWKWKTEVEPSTSRSWIRRSYQYITMQHRGVFFQWRFIRIPHTLPRLFQSFFFERHFWKRRQSKYHWSCERYLFLSPTAVCAIHILSQLNSHGRSQDIRCRGRCTHRRSQGWKWEKRSASMDLCHFFVLWWPFLVIVFDVLN